MSTLSEIIKAAVNGYSAGVAITAIGAWLMSDPIGGNQIIGVIVLGAGVLMVSAKLIAELSFKQKRHEAPWLFERYKGE